MFRLVVTMAALAAIAPPLAAAERPWVEARSDRFTVVTNVGERQARATVRLFEQVRAVFRTIAADAPQEPGKPFTILVARDEATMKRLLPAYWERKGGARPGGLFLDRPTQAIVVLQAEQGPTETWSHSVVFHEYVHFLVARQFEYLPVWLNEGFAEFFATCSVESDRVTVGRAAPWNLQLLQQASPLPMERLLAVDHASPEYNEGDRTSVFYAQSWALVHYLMHGSRGVHRPRLGAYLDLVARGVDPVEAGRQGLGDLKALGRELGTYVHSFQFFMLPVATPDVPPEKSFRTRLLSPAEVQAALAAVHAATDRRAEARAAAEEALRLDPGLAGPWQVLAELHAREERGEEALRAAREAVRADGGSVVARHLLASRALAEGDWETAEKELARAVEINDAFTAGQVMLAFVRHQLGRPTAQVMPHVRRALELEPGNAYFQVTLSGVLRERGDARNADALARRALRMARTPEERAYVQGTLDEIARSARRVGPAGAGEAPAETSSPPVRLAPDAPTPPPACDIAAPTTCHTLAEALRSQGGAVELDHAVELYALACGRGVAESCFRLGLLYAAGQGVEADLGTARGLLDRACRLKHQEACRAAAGLPAQ